MKELYNIVDVKCNSALCYNIVNYVMKLIWKEINMNILLNNNFMRFMEIIIYKQYLFRAYIEPIF